MRKLLGVLSGLLQTPTGMVLAIALLWHGILWWFQIPFNLVVSAILLLLDLVAALLLVGRMEFFFSQFVLPIQNPKDRRQIYDRVKYFDTGRRGPALFIKNGRVIEHEGERDKRGPGVIVQIGRAHV